MRFPRAVLGEAHQWLRETFPTPPPPQEEEEGGGKGEVAEATAMATDQPGGTTAMSVESPPREANGTSASSGDTTASAATAAVGAPPVPSGASGADEVEAGAEGIKEEADREASAAVAAAASERARQGWDAVFAPGFEDCYKDGGHEHEVCVFFSQRRPSDDGGGTSINPAYPLRKLLEYVSTNTNFLSSPT